MGQSRGAEPCRTPGATRDAPGRFSTPLDASDAGPAIDRTCTGLPRGPGTNQVEHVSDAASQIRQRWPGTCPMCGIAIEPVDTGGSGASPICGISPGGDGSPRW